MLSKLIIKICEEDIQTILRQVGILKKKDIVLGFDRDVVCVSTSVDNCLRYTLSREVLSRILGGVVILATTVGSDGCLYVTVVSNTDTRVIARGVRMPCKRYHEHVIAKLSEYNYGVKFEDMSDYVQEDALAASLTNLQEFKFPEGHPLYGDSDTTPVGD